MKYTKSLSLIVSLVLLPVSFILFPSAQTGAETLKVMQWEIQADKMTRYEDPPSVIAEGNVVLTKTEQVTRQKKAAKQNDWGDLLGDFAQDTPADDAASTGSKALPALTDNSAIDLSGEKSRETPPAGLVEVEIPQTADPEIDTGSDLENDPKATSKSLPVISATPAAADDTIATDEEAETADNDEMVTTTTLITTIKADWMVHDVDLGTVKVRGNVLIDVGADQLTAASGLVNLSRETGTFEDATIIRQYKEMHFEGRVIEKTGDVTYHIEDGWLITCKLKEGETPPWSFKAKEADITDGGYAYLKHATFRIKNVPILYTPIMILPAKRSRQTGFLFPNMTLSERDGFGFEWPFFVNLSPSSDITLYPRYIEKRGFMIGGEFRYVLNPDSKGSLMANYLSDSLIDWDNPDNYDYYIDGGYTHLNQDRYWIRGKMDQDFGDWTTRMDLDIVSDRDYLTEFNTGLTGFNLTEARYSSEFGRGFQAKTVDERRNSLRTLRSWDNGTSLEAGLIAFDDVYEENDCVTVDNDTTCTSIVMRLPQFKYTGLLPIYETGVDFSWKAEYVNFWRDKGLSVQRIDIFPRVTAPVPLLGSYLEAVVSAGVRDTMYAMDANGDDEWVDSDTENRFLGDFRAEVATTVRRDFAYNGESISTWSHTFRPFVRYKYLTDVDQEYLPEFDDVDTIADQNKVSYGLNNFFYISGSKNGREFEREYGYIKFQQNYDIRDAESETPFSAVEARIAWFPLEAARFIYKTDLDVYDDGFTKHIFEGDYRNSRGDIFSMDYLLYNVVDSDDTSSIRFATRLGLVYNFSIGYSLEQSLEDSVTVQELYSLVYHPSCWSVELAGDNTPGNEQISLMFRLANIGAPIGFDMMAGEE